MWMIGHGPDLVRQGYTFLCIAEPIMLLQAKLAEANAATKSSPARPADTATPPLP